jgi:hypothetical protein
MASIDQQNIPQKFPYANIITKKIRDLRQKSFVSGKVAESLMAY